MKEFDLIERKEIAKTLMDMCFKCTVTKEQKEAISIAIIYLLKEK